VKGPLELIALIEEFVPNDICDGSIEFCDSLDLFPFYTHRPVLIGRHRCLLKGNLRALTYAEMPRGEMTGETFVVSVTKFPCKNYGGIEAYKTGEPLHFSNHDVVFAPGSTIYVVRKSDDRWCAVKNDYPFISITE
jgi:hypothetical protein